MSVDISVHARILNRAPSEPAADRWVRHGNRSATSRKLHRRWHRGLAPALLMFLAAVAPDALAGDRSAIESESVPDRLELTAQGATTGVQVQIFSDARECVWPDAPEGTRGGCVEAVAEGGSHTLVFTTVSGNPHPLGGNFSYWTIDLSAEDGSDYIGKSGTLRIEKGATSSSSASISVLDDEIDEDEEYFVIRWQSTVPTTTDYKVVPIADDDDPPSVSIGDAAVDENGGSLDFEVSLSGKSGKQITVNYATADGTATAPADYTTTTGTATIAPGKTTATISVPVVDDNVDEADEDITVTLSNAVNATLDADEGTGTGTIRETAALTVSVADASGLEDSVGNLAFVVRVSTAGTEAGSVQYATSNGTASAGSDYTATTGTLNFAVGDTAMTVNVPVHTDTTIEPDETLTLTLSSGNNLQIRDGTATGTIVNDDFELAIVESREGPERGSLVFPVTLRGGGSGRTTVSVDYATVAGTATQGTDYVGNSGTLEFLIEAADQVVAVNASIAVDVREDDRAEADEQFEVVLSNPVGAVLTTARSTATILDDDKPEVTVDNAKASEDAGPLSFAVRLSASSDAVVTVDYATGDFTATAGEDYVARDDTLRFAPGDRVRNIEVTVIDDTAVEDDEVIDLKLTGAENAILVQQDVFSCPFPAEENVIRCAIGTIEDDDTAITLSVADAAATESEGELEFEVTATGLDDPDLEVTVRYATSDDTAVAGSDYDSASGTLTFTSTQTARTIAVSVKDDLLHEPAETLTLTLSDAANAELGDASAVGTIEDDDAASTGVTLTASLPRVREDAGPTDVEVTATLDASARLEATTVTVTVSGSGETDAVDFADVSGFAIEIPAQETSATGTFTLTPEDDEVDEADETVSIGGESDLDVTGATIALVDDDPTSTGIDLSASPARASEGVGTVEVEVTATLDAGARLKATAVSVTVSGSGEAGAVDFAEVPGFAIEIPARETSGTGSFTLAPEDDILDETDETLTVSGSSDLPVTEAAVTLADDDEPPTSVLLTASPERLSEGEGTRDVTVTAALDRSALAEDLAVAVTVSGTAGAGAVDFEATPPEFTVTITAGETTGSGTFSVTPEDDDVDEVDEALGIAGSSELPVTGASVALADDDATSSSIILSATPTTVAEGAGQREVEVTATLDAGARLDATAVSVTVSGSGDPDAVDFEPVDGFTVTIAAGEISGTGAFTLMPEDDGVAESNETLEVEGNADLPVEAATVTLVDDDAASTGIVLSASPPRVSEGDGAAEVRVTASLNRAARQEATTVTVSVSGSGEPDAADFAPVDDFEVTIPMGSASGEGVFTLTPEDDGVAETDETLTLTGAADLPVTETTVTLADDDETSTGIVLSAAPSRLTEGAGTARVEVTASLDRGLRSVPTTVTVSVSGSGESDAVDFAPVEDFEVTIPAGSASGAGAFMLTPEADAVTETDETLTVSGESDLPVTPDTVLLADDDAASTRIDLSLQPSRVSEGAGPTAIEVTATLDGGLRRQATTVTVSVSGSGEPDAADFAPVEDFGVIIAAGAASGTGTFTLRPEADRNVEANETVSVTGRSDLPVTPATLVLADDDEVSTRILLHLSVNPAQASEGGGPVEVTVTAAVDRASREVATRIAVAVSGSGDPLAVDFAPVGDFEIVIPANALEGEAVFTVTPEDDLVVERDETLTVSGSSDLPVTPTTLRLLDDDAASVRLSASPSEVPEGGGPATVTVTAALTGGVRQEATEVTVTVTGSGDPDAVDFAPVEDFAITIPAGATRGEGAFTLAPEDDTLEETDEKLTVSGSSNVPVKPTSVKILDDDAPGAFASLAVADASATEGGGELAFQVTLSARSAAEVTVRYATSDGTAVSGSDYEATSGTLVFASGEVSKTVRVALIDDALHEPDETLGLDLSAPRNGTLERASATGTIVDDDELPALSIADASGSERDGELAFAVTLGAPVADAVTVGYATSDGTAEAGADYRSADGELTLAAGETAATIRVEVIDDALDEADAETFAVTLSGISGAAPGDLSATGTIMDDDAPPAMTVSDAAGDEAAGPLTFTVSLDGPSALEVTVDYATSDGTAEAGSDYEAVSGTLAIAPGTMTGTVSVPVLDDAGHEPDETFVLELSAPRNAVLADVSATGTILDDDLSPPSVSGQLPAAMLCVGGAPYGLDLSAYFDGEELRFSAVPSTPSVATALLEESWLTVAPVSEGESSVTVTVTNDAGSVVNSISVRVVTDPAELEAVDSLLASMGRGLLTTVTESVRVRFDSRGKSGEKGVSTNVERYGVPETRGTRGIIGNRWSGLRMQGDPSGGLEGRGLFGSQASGDDWFDEMHRTGRRGTDPFSFSLDSAHAGSTGRDWAVWGRGDIHRFESGVDGSAHDGSLAAIHLGVDTRVDDWLAGLSLTRSRVVADYRFERSVDACGGGTGEGRVDAELMSVHPYIGRQVGRGQVWAALGAGSGEVSLERCESGQHRETICPWAWRRWAAGIRSRAESGSRCRSWRRSACCRWRRATPLDRSATAP